MNTNIHSHSRQDGVSMVELMIAMLIGSLLLVGVLQIFSSNKSTFNVVEGLSHIQDNARAGIERMKMQVRLTGYMGCSNMRRIDFDPVNNTAGANAIVFNENVLVQGVDNDAAVNTTVDGTDSVTIFSAVAANTALANDMAGSNSNVRLDSNPLNFAPDDILILTDCITADIFRVTEVLAAGNGDPLIRHRRDDPSGTRYNTNNRLSKAYTAADSVIMRMRNVTYDVQNTGRNDEAGNPILSLFETVNGGNPVEIMTGVEDMQVTYGEDTNSDGEADSYRTAAQVTASNTWSEIVSMRFNVLVSSARPIGPDNRPYTDLAGAQQTVDRRMRRSFTTTVGLRNRSS